MKTIFPALLLFPFFQLASAKVIEWEVSYESGGVTMYGLLAWDDSSDAKRPGILVVHEWWGHNDYARKRARDLAELGYVALAVDMYGDGKSTGHPKEAGAFAGAVMKDLPLAKARFESALELINEHPLVDPTKNAAIGYCFGGGIVLNMASMGVELDGVVSFHGSLGIKTDIKPNSVKAKILVCNGEDDKLVSQQSIQTFKQKMNAARADFAFRNYKGAQHGFTNPGATEKGKEFGLPIAYQEAADIQSWMEMGVFLKTLWTLDAHQGNASRQTKDFENIVTNLAGEFRTRFINVSFQVTGSHPEFGQIINANSSRIREATIRYFSGMSLKEINNNPRILSKAKGELLLALNKLEGVAGAIEKLRFTAFNIQ